MVVERLEGKLYDEQNSALFQYPLTASSGAKAMQCLWFSRYFSRVHTGTLLMSPLGFWVFSFLVCGLHNKMQVDLYFAKLDNCKQTGPVSLPGRLEIKQTVESALTESLVITALLLI